MTKKVLMIVMLAVYSACICASAMSCTSASNGDGSRDSISSSEDAKLSDKDRYKMYQTENIYTLLRLDTKTGRIDQVQWSLEDGNEGSVPVNSVDYSAGYKCSQYGAGVFELYPTKNMYQFILLNKVDGRMWHIQWGMEASKRWVNRIDSF